MIDSMINVMMLEVMHRTINVMSDVDICSSMFVCQQVTDDT
jgi:hypothetical protein